MKSSRHTFFFGQFKRCLRVAVVIGSRELSFHVPRFLPFQRRRFFPREFYLSLAIPVSPSLEADRGRK